MTPQTPAEGILVNHDYGDAKHYTVACDCTDPDHEHNIWIEADEMGVTVMTCTKQSTNDWDETIKKSYNIDNWFLQRFDWFWKGIWNSLAIKLKLTYGIWVHGYLEYQAALIMSQQSALNYAETLKKAIIDVQEFRANKGKINV
jgi:hypothetical protein